jgi:hypothetical protein
MPVNADISILQYHPDIIYLGRQPTYIERDSLPSNPKEQVQYIYALVHDAYGKIVNATLSYTIDHKNETDTMTLINGIPSNGTWMGVIPKPRNVSASYTVAYTAYFRDDLNYFVRKYGPYYAGNDYNLNNEGKGYNVTSRYIRSAEGIFKNTTTTSFVAMVSDPTMPHNVMLHYKLIRNRGDQWNSISMKLVPKVTFNSIQRYMKFYSIDLTVPSDTREILFYSTLHDDVGSINSELSSTYHHLNLTHINTISVETYVLDVDVDNKTVDMEIRLHGPLINFLTLTIPYTQRLRDLGNINLQLKDNINNNEQIIPGSFTNRTDIISPDQFSSFHAKIGSLNIGSLYGDPTSFPYDHYFVNLTIKIPLKLKAQDIIYYSPEYGSAYRTTWDPIPWNPKNDKVWNDQNSTLLQMYMEFNRSNSSYQAEYTTLPLLLVFFLLGTICFLEPEDIGTRTTITLGIFAFVFAFATILTDMKPQYAKHVLTLADFLLRLVLVAAIVSTISSVVGYRTVVTIERQQADKNGRMVTIESKKDKWINRIQRYSLYDLAALVFVSVIILNETVITNLVALEYPYLVIYPVIIIIGLGWGLLCRVILKTSRVGKVGVD